MPKRSSGTKAFGFGYGDWMIRHEKGLPVKCLIFQFTYGREEEMNRRLKESGHFAHTVIKSGTGSGHVEATAVNNNMFDLSPRNNFPPQRTADFSEWYLPPKCVLGFR